MKTMCGGTIGVEVATRKATMTVGAKTGGRMALP